MVHTKRPFSENLVSAFEICKVMTTEELLELAIRFGSSERKNDTWAFAIAKALEKKNPAEESKICLN